MIHTESNRHIILKILLITILLFGMFGLVYLRSSVMKLEYSIGELEKIRGDYLRERKIMLAEKTTILSFEKLETSLNKSEGFIVPDRVKVIHLKRQKGYLPYKAAFNKHVSEP
jgi:hypothetical protein